MPELVSGASHLLHYGGDDAALGAEAPAVIRLCLLVVLIRFYDAYNDDVKKLEFLVRPVSRCSSP